ncbi:MAG TPA: KpsF/GutQ family sugar-phosphate isomerase [Acidobacteriota bacterium]|nr:KpsF/GutQ family sugar-phosphate isomerase [Acidobacteriota bacterium]
MSKELARQVLRIESEAIAALVERVDESFEEALRLLSSCRGRVVATGMGKSGLICRKIAATLASTGTPALFMHPAEAIHGDLGMLTSDDLVLALSNSGETEELIRLLATLKRLGVPIIAMVGNRESTLAKRADVAFDVGVDREACSIGLAPTASTTAALAWGDALAVALSQRKGFALDDFARLHPGGGLGKRLARIDDLMHEGDRLPSVPADAPMDEVIYEMSSKGLGITAVVDTERRLVGVVSDGDLRRLLQKGPQNVLTLKARDCMTPSPVSIGPAELAVEALRLMEQRKITSVMVVDPGNKLVGVIHLHDLWGTEMF